MARQGKIENEYRKQKLNSKYDKKREELKAIIKNKENDMKKKLEAMKELQKLPRMSARNRLKNRDSEDGNTRSYYRMFGLCRWSLKEKIIRKEIPGLVHASW